MEKQTVIIADETENGVLNRIGKAYIAIPEIRFGAARLVGWLINSRHQYVEREVKKCEKS